MTAAAELAALRGIARRLSTTERPIDARQAKAWGASISGAARGLARVVDFLRAEAAGMLPEVEADGGYEGLTLDEAATRYASRVLALLLASGSADDARRERQAFLAAVDALSGPPRTQRARGVAAASATANGAGSARLGGSDTSTLAALAVTPRTGGQRRRVLDAVAAVARDPRVVGLTDLQLAHATGLGPNSVRPRRVELVAGGWLEAAPEKREHHGTLHTVWVLTQKAAATAELWQQGAA